jgi:hypothetical protein
LLQLRHSIFQGAVTPTAIKRCGPHGLSKRHFINYFLLGDSGYFSGFKQIGAKYGPFDMTFIERDI